MSKQRAARKERSGKRRTMLGLLLVLVLAGVAAGGYVVTRGWPQSAAAADGAPSAATGTPTSAPRTENPAGTSAPLQPTDSDVAGEAADPTEGQTVATDEPVVVTSTEVPVRITYAEWDKAAGQVVAGGLIGGVVESDGTCRLSLTQNGRTVAVEAPVTPDAANTYCAELVVPGQRLAAGVWQAVLTYQSESYAGTSPAVNVEVVP